MGRLSNRIDRLVRDEAGVTSIEYALIASLVSVTVISALMTIGATLSAALNAIADAIPIF